ncbi:hypothetical protein HDV03_001670 [Kappamyces sp. JEL0829]|nr:hypothetical protein HDV03_001670 [Kappamyces sp. JEL0829]
MCRLVLLLLAGFIMGQSSCPTTPTDSACAAYALDSSNVTTLTGSLCGQMPHMTSCTLPSTAYSNPFQWYATICFDMPSMSSCQPYLKMCGTQLPLTGLAQQCSRYPPLASFPSTATVTKAIYSICSEMNMADCSACKISGADAIYANCDLLDTYAKLCMSMPGMQQCAAYSSMCAANPSLTWCPASSSVELGPTMLMYFHTGIRDYILFQSWVPTNSWQYTVALVGCFLLAVVYEGLTAWSTILEIGWRKELRSSVASSSAITMDAFGAQPVQKPVVPVWSHLAGMSHGAAGVKAALCRSLLRFLTISLSFVLMLVVMSFNVGIFFVVMFGYSVGTFLFAPIAKGALSEGESLLLAEDTKDCH